MPSIQNLIGERFENIFSANFSGFSKTDHGNQENLPDFFNWDYGFWAETKVGNKRFNAQLKEYQINNFKNLKRPFLYVIGFHDFDNAHERLDEKTDNQRREILKKDLKIVSMYWVSSIVSEGIYNGEWRINQKGTIKYCDLKQRFLEGIINDAITVRNGEKVRLLNYYGLKRKDLVIRPLNKSVAKFPRGVILDSKLDRLAIKYLERNDVL